MSDPDDFFPLSSESIAALASLIRDALARRDEAEVRRLLALVGRQPTEQHTDRTAEPSTPGADDDHA